MMVKSLLNCEDCNHLLLSGGWDGRVVLWDVRGKGEEIGRVDMGGGRGRIETKLDSQYYRDINLEVVG
jgi:hypothetical protein